MKYYTNLIIRNSAKCLKCNEEIESKHRHDFRFCKCGNLAVDGGQDYLKRAGNLDSFEETSVTKDVERAPHSWEVADLTPAD